MAYSDELNVKRDSDMATETPIETDRWFGQEVDEGGSEALPSPESLPSPEYSQAHLQAAASSVRALVADLRYIMGNEDAVRWPSLASAALQHHSPDVPEDQLTHDLRELQKYGRAALNGVCHSDFNAIRDAILELRAVEARLHEG